MSFTAEGAECAEEKREFEMRTTAEELNSILEHIIGCAIAVHRGLGPGLLESAYEACLEYELTKSGLRTVRQSALPVIYDSVRVECGYRIDLLVNDSVIIELKSVDHLDRIHEAQLHTYLRLTGLHLGLLINFNVVKLVDGIKRIVYRFPSGFSSAPSAPSAVIS